MMEKEIRDNKVLDILQSHDGMQTTFQIGIKCYKAGYQKSQDKDLSDVFRNFIRSKHLSLEWEKFLEVNKTTRTR